MHEYFLVELYRCSLNISLFSCLSIKVSKKIHYLTSNLKIWVNVTQNVAKYPLHHETYVDAKVEVATSNGLGDALTRKNT